MNHETIGYGSTFFAFTPFAILQINEKCKMGTRKTLLKTYIVSWYGPFHSIEEMAEWECLQDIDFCLYLVQGKKPNAKIYSYYCGQTTRTVLERFTDRNHHIREIPNLRSIWIGAIENRHNEQDIDIAENMFIDLLSGGVKEKQSLNRQSKRFKKHKRNFFFICKWNNPKRYRQPECSLKLVLPEVVVYFADTDEIKIAKRLCSL